MSQLVGRVRFEADIDGKGMPRDAERVGMQAGRAGAKGFGEEWDKEFRKGLTQQGKAQLAHWRSRGSTDGLAYGRGLEVEVTKFAGRLNKAFDNFQGLQINSNFMDEFVGKSGDWEKGIAGLKDELSLLNRQGAITDTQFANSTGTIDRWIGSQDRATVSVGNTRKSLLEMGRDIGGISLKWGDLSNNTRQWTLIVGAVTAALTELAGLSSAAGSGLLVLGGAATGAGIGLGATISAIVGLNKDIGDLPVNLRPARAGLDDFKKSFSDLNAVITESAFQNSESAWRSLGATVRGLSPAFAVVGKSISNTLDGLAKGIAPGTRNFQKLSDVVAGSAPQFEKIMGTAGKLGEALLSAFSNPQMQRSVSELLGWIDDLVVSFADFTDSSAFDTWLANGRAVFGSFGELLRTTGQLLNDLVTPASIARLNQFMDNLGTFLDTGGRGILEFADQLNIFGILSAALAEVGEALEPLREPMAELGGAISGALIPALAGAADWLGVVAQVTAPVAQALADLIGAAPPWALQALGAGLAAVATGMGLLKGAATIQGLVGALTGISVEGGKATSALGKVGRAAGLVGLGVVGVTALATGLEDLQRKMSDIEARASAAVSSNASLSASYADLGKSAFGMSYELTDASGALDMLGSVGTGIERFFPTLGAVFSDTGRQANQLAATLSEIDAPLAQMASTSIPDAVSKFQSYAQELGATQAQQLLMLEQMPQLKAQFEGAAAGADGLATKQELLTLLTGSATAAAATNTASLTQTASQAALTATSVDDLASAIRGFGDTSLSARDAERQFQAAIDEVSASVAANGTSLDINTEQGRANQAALDQIASSALEASAAKLELTGSESQASAAIQGGRDALINQLAQFGITGQAAEDYANELGLIPGNIPTSVTLNGVQAAESALNSLARERFARIVASITTTNNSGGSSGRDPFGQVPRAASGMLLTGPRRILAGEAGAEAIVPLQRSLNQVDPSVRWLSAIAQGKAAPMASGGIVGGGKSVTFTEGAIVVQGYFDPRQAAIDVSNEVAERVSS